MGLLDSLIYGIRNIFDPSNTQLPTRSQLKFLSGSGITVSLADNTSTGTTEVTVTSGGSGGGGLPGTPDNSFQYRKSDGTFGGQSNLLETSGGQVNHLGSPMHQEAKAVFRTTSDSATTTAPTYAESWSIWNAIQTTNATATTILTLSFPAASYGDALICAEVMVSVGSHGGGGGLITRRVVYNRTSGTLAVVHEDDTTIAAGLTIAVTIAGSVVNNDTLAIQVTGIAATNINWFAAASVQIVRKP